MTRLIVGVTVLAACLSLAACLPLRPPSGSETEQGDPPFDTDFKRLPPLLSAISKADAVALYEGLPHQTFEKDRLEGEKATNKTVSLFGYPFYAAPLPLKSDDSKKLLAALSDARSYRDFGGEKLCGGFHPDYAVEFEVGKVKYHVLVCFGCGEAKLCGPKRGLRVDLSGDGQQDFAALLKPNRQNRPEKFELVVKPADLTPVR